MKILRQLIFRLEKCVGVPPPMSEFTRLAQYRSTSPPLTKRPGSAPVHKRTDQFRLGVGAEVSCPNIFSIACPKIKSNITIFFPENGYLKNSGGGDAAPSPPPPPRLVRLCTWVPTITAILTGKKPHLRNPLRYTQSPNQTLGPVLSTWVHKSHLQAPL